MALPPYDFLTSAPTDQLGTGLGKDFDYLSAYRSGQGIRNDVDYSNQPMMAVMPPPFTIGDNPDVISDMNLPDYYNFQKYMRERGAADLINPQNQIPVKDVGNDSKGIGEIILPPIAGGGDGGGGGVEGPINYNNLIVRDQSTGTGIDFIDRPLPQDLRTNTIESLRKQFNENKALQARFDSFEDYIKQSYPQGLEPQKTGILQKLKNFDLSKMPSIAFLNSILGGKADPRAVATRDFYGDNFGLTSSGSVGSGIMKNYNPISGGFLNMITGGRLGEEATYGLDEAMGERMGNIKNMLSKKHKQNFSSMDDEEFETFIKSTEGQKLFRYGEKYGSPGYTSAAENFLKIKLLKEKEAEALKEARKKQQEKIKKQQEIQRQEFLKSDTRNNPTTGTVAIQQKLGSSVGNKRYEGGGGFDSTSSKPDRDKGSVTRESAAKSKGVGGGGYTRSDTTRESYRGRANGGRIGYGTGGIVSL